ncbi:branched-chain amino acid ABC transporter permease [Streptomonospora sp. PA3]|uniref:AzlC family ABC transporter permease n=1 Tax=Streptomonospora sp. PA3 TaxID=2607326 RepID=UPI0012DC6992|nr:AzlC family ABC transporter permease [Streptomonospora sp. PA3]MUL40821.1 branched-chain amino acid ABC transporter permease [Streptomonospora sp. PA3]
MGVAVGLSGTAFGAAAVTAGLSVPQACVLSLFAFTGASQFALVGVIAGGGSLAAGAAGALLLGARNTLYGLRMADLLPWRGPRRLLAAHGIIDETAAGALSQPTAAWARTSFVTVFASIYLTWNLMTLVGALATERIGDTDAFGLDAMSAAVFLALIAPRLREGHRERAVAVLAAAIALAAVPFLPPGVPVLLASAAALIVPGRGPSGRSGGDGAAAGSGGDGEDPARGEVRT